MTGKKSILIVDDDESICRSLALVFNKKGYETETAATGKEAVEKAKQRYFNLGLLDIKLPDVEGMGLIAPLKEIHPDIVVIIVTAYASLETAVRVLNEGASGYITKPLNMNAVLAAVKEALHKQNLMLENRRLYQEAQRELAERKRAEEALQKSHQLLARTFASLHDAIFIIDADTVEIVDCNPAASQMLGYSRREMLGRPTDFLYADEAAPHTFRKHLYPYAEKKGVVSLLEFKLRCKDGTVFPAEHSIMSLEDEQGKGIGWVSIIRNIAERRRAEEALRTYVEGLEKIVQNRSRKSKGSGQNVALSK